MYLVKNRYKPFLFVVDVLGHIFIRPFIKKDFSKHKAKKILVIRLEHIGIL